MNTVDITEAQLKDMLAKGTVKIVFEKKDKSSRTLEATLQTSQLPPIDPTKPVRAKKPCPGMVNVYVPELKGWRGFNMDQLLEQPVLIP